VARAVQRRLAMRLLAILSLLLAAIVLLVTAAADAAPLRNSCRVAAAWLVVG
jgi:hypothetical protein